MSGQLEVRYFRENTVLILLIYRQRNSQSMSVFDRPLLCVCAESTATLESDVKDKRESIVEDVELPDHHYNQESNI